MRVIVTRPRAQAESLAAALRDAGFDAVLCPLIEIEEIDDGPIDVGPYDWVVVTSANGATELVRRRSGTLPRVAAVGEATARALAESGIEADFVPGETSEGGLVEELPRPAGRVLFVGAEGAGAQLRSELGADVRAVYRIRELQPAERPSGDLVALASPSAARVWARLGSEVPAITIGHRTTAAARAAGIDVVGEARTQDVRGLVDCAAAWLASSRS
jgi:uroporphyrinogen-III synthase